jgi:hypothetical protein
VPRRGHIDILYLKWLRSNYIVGVEISTSMAVTISAGGDAPRILNKRELDMATRKQDLYARAYDVFMGLLDLPGHVHPLEVARAMTVCAHIMHLCREHVTTMGTTIWDELIEDSRQVLRRRLREILRESVTGEGGKS